MRAPSTRAAPNGGARSPRPFHDRTNSAGMLFALTCALLFWALFFGGGDGTDRLAWIGGGALALGLWRAARRSVDGVLLVLAAVLVVLLAYSRGGIVVGAAAAAAWLALDRRRLESLAALVIGGGGAVAVAGVSLALHGVTDDGQPRSVRAHDGLLFLLAVVVAATVVAGLAWRASR